MRWANTCSPLFLTLSNGRMDMNSRDCVWCLVLVLLDHSRGWYEACWELGAGAFPSASMESFLVPFASVSALFFSCSALLFHWIFSTSVLFEDSPLSPIWNWVGRNWLISQWPSHCRGLRMSMWQLLMPVLCYLTEKYAEIGVPTPHLLTHVHGSTSHQYQDVEATS